MPKHVFLIGHCGADGSYLRIAVARAVSDARVVVIEDESELDREIESAGSGGGDVLLLVNRLVDWGFSTDSGVELIRATRQRHPRVRAMLVSNFSDAQQSAVEAGALHGFGKREINTPRVAAALAAAWS